MNRIVVVLALAACGGKSKPAEPVANTAPTQALPTPIDDRNIRVVQRGSAGGVIELLGDRDAAMRAADKEMASTCGAGRYVITQEGEEAIADPNASPSGPPTRTETAWRVHYQCAK
jgi:hypothetical protein